jgi:hypothetical protein
LHAQVEHRQPSDAADWGEALRRVSDGCLMSPQLQAGLHTLQHVAQAEVLALFAAISGVVLFQLLTGRINTRGLLADSSGPISPVRVQLLLGTLGVAGACLIGRDHVALFDPTVAGSVAGASNLLYLVRKYLKPNTQEV